MTVCSDRQLCAHTSASRVRFVLILPMLLAGCNALPRDTAGTSERVAATHVIQVGVTPPLAGEGRAFLERLARDRAARMAVRRQALEPLLLELEDGRLDVVVAPFAADTGWAERVALTDPLDGAQPDARPFAVRAAVRNGEHRWQMRVEHLARQGPDQ